MNKLNIKLITEDHFIEKSILLHPAWHGKITGLESEALLKFRHPYSYLLREGEKRSHYYVSFVAADQSTRHQPFAIIYTKAGWYCRQGTEYGPFITQTVDDLIPRIMHCNIEDCKPLMKS
jgi:hypothetical protein